MGLQRFRHNWARDGWWINWARRIHLFKKKKWGTSLAVQWLRLHFPCKGCRFDPLMGGLKILNSSWPKNQNIKQKQYSNKFDKRMVHIKKHLSKKKKKENDYKFLTYQISLDQGSANFQAQLDVCFLFFGGPLCTACGILVLWPGTELRPLAEKVWSPNHWTPAF